jgi:hypothetical protein
MSSPVDELREEDARRSGGYDHEQRVEASVLLRALAELRARGDDDVRARLLVGRRVTSRSRHHQARFELAEEGGVFRQRRSEARFDAARGSRLPRQPLKALGAAFHQGIRARHFFAGGASPVAMRQILDARRRAAIVAAAPRLAYKPVQSALRSTLSCLPKSGFAKPGYDDRAPS